ncbi:hypothetical protein [Lentzea aerocolonigenes]|jgi:hypothetical protein|uniref:hypothetical protein n=1 Tax=Lentzea aerocolonigenes TaxID=68170 RepID=UPI0005674DF9|nr:hypothetical protein [Lentzea aerocolonigenes]
MGTVAGKVRGAGEGTKASSDKIAQTEMGKQDFGKAHETALTGYQTGIQKLAKCAQSFVTASADFAARLEASKGGYEWVESENTQKVSK